MKNKKTIIFAHRGASGLVKHENTIDAFQKAIEVGAFGIELDIRKTLDNIIVVNHNPNIQTAYIKDHTYQELLEITRGLGYELATFEETLQFCKGKIFLDIELKETGYEEDIIEMLDKYLTTDEYYIRSFIEEAIIRMKELNPNITTILLMGSLKKDLKTRLKEIFPIKALKRTGCDMVSPYFKLLLFGYVKRLHRRGYEVSVWTVNSKEDMEKMYKKGVDYIITNYPDLALKTLNEYENK